MYFFQDWKVNKKNVKARFILLAFRVAQCIRRSSILITLMFLPYLIFYRFFVEWILGVELPWNLVVGKNLKIYHGQGLVVNDKTIIGENVVLRQNTTIGHKINNDGTRTKAPVIGNGVDIGANCVLIGDISIGDNVIIGAGSVVTKSVQSNVIIAGNPAKIIKYL